MPRGQGIDTGGWDDDRQVSFDIFVKGQMTRSTTFFKSAGGEKPRFRMFPVVDNRRGRKVDLYGETIDIGIWQRKGKEIEEEGESEIVKMAKRRKIEEEEKQVSSLAGSAAFSNCHSEVCLLLSPSPARATRGPLQVHHRDAQGSAVMWPSLH